VSRAFAALSTSTFARAMAGTAADGLGGPTGEVERYLDTPGGERL
jgi:hypothetical protein